LSSSIAEIPPPEIPFLLTVDVTAEKAVGVGEIGRFTVPMNRFDTGNLAAGNCETVV